MQIEVAVVADYERRSLEASFDAEGERGWNYINHTIINTMRIIGLYGHEGCGKSPTMNYLKEELRTVGCSVSSKPHPNCETPETFNYKGLLICVAPGGDNELVMQKNIDYFEKKQCDIAITACRCKGAPVDILNRFAHYQSAIVEWIPKSYEHNLCDETKDLCNKETACFLLSLL